MNYFNKVFNNHYPFDLALYGIFSIPFTVIEGLQGVWPKIIPVAMEMSIFYVNFSSLNYPNLKDESLGAYG